MRALLAGLILVLMTCSCAAPVATEADPLATAPADFTVDLAVIARPAELGGDLSLSNEIEQRPCRFILFADGSLHFASPPDGRVMVKGVPPLARILSRRQVADIWSLMRQLGFASPETAHPTVNFETLKPERGERLQLVAFSGSGKHWNFVRRTPLVEPPDPAIGQLVRLLGDLAWADDAAGDNSPVMPRRYDFGADPYVRYRTPRHAPLESPAAAEGEPK